VAVCFFLVQLGVLGGSILSLLFHIGFRIERMNETGQAPVE